MPRSFMREPRKMYNVREGEEFEARFIAAEKGGVMTALRVNGKIAFPERRGLQPKPEEIWVVKIAGQNPAGSVYFLKCLKFVSSEASRQAAWEAEVTAQKSQRERDMEVLNARLPQIREKIQGLLPLLTNEALDLGEGISIQLSSNMAKVESMDPIEGIVGSLRQYVHIRYGEGFVAETFESFFKGWEHVSLRNMHWVPEGGREVEVKFNFFGQEPKALYPGKVVKTYRQDVPFEDQRRDKRVRREIYQVIEAETPLGMVEVQMCVHEDPRRGFAKSAWDQGPVDALLAEIEAEKLAYLQIGEENKAFGLLSVDPGNCGSVLSKMPGFGIARWAEFGQCVIRPELSVIFEGSAFKLVPLKMRGDAPVDAWSMITFEAGREVDEQAIEDFLQKTTEKLEILSAEEYQKWLQTNSADLAIEVLSSVETGDKTPGYEYRYNVRFAMPFKVSKLLDLGWSPVVRSVAIEVRQTELKTGYGNRPFTGKLAGKLEQGTRYSKDYVGGVYYPYFQIPKTEAELKAAEEKVWSGFIADCNRDRATLAGWRYTDTGNPVVYIFNKVQGGDGYWIHMELVVDETNPRLVWRKGGNSRKGETSTLDPAAINFAMKSYASSGWPVAKDDSLPQGKRLLAYLGFE